MKILKRKASFQGKIFEIQEVSIETDSGEEEVRELVIRADSVGVIPIFENGDLLLIEEYALGADKVILTIPGGKLEPMKTPEESAANELLEETGYTASSWTRLVSLHGDPVNYLARKIHLFVARDIHPSASHLNTQFESITTRRMSPLTFLDMCRQDYVSHPEAIAAILLLIYRGTCDSK